MHTLFKDKADLFVTIGEWRKKLHSAKIRGDYIFSNEIFSLYTKDVLRVPKKFQISIKSFANNNLAHEYLTDVKHAVYSDKNNNLKAAQINEDGFEKYVSNCVSELNKEYIEKINEMNVNKQKLELELKHIDDKLDKLDYDRRYYYRKGDTSKVDEYDNEIIKFKSQANKIRSELLQISNQPTDSKVWIRADIMKEFPKI